MLYIQEFSASNQPSFPANCNEARSVSLMRVCHPSPVARKAMSTSASILILMGSLVAMALGRPRNLVCKEVGRVDKDLKAAGSTSDRSLTSPLASIFGKRETMFCSFSWIGFAKADEANAVFRLAKDKHMQALGHITQRDKAQLRVAVPCVMPELGRLKVEILDLVKTQPTFKYVARVFDGIKGDFHLIIVPPLNRYPSH